MNNAFIIFLIITFGVLLYSCKKSTVEPTTPVNQIINSSFEVDGNPSLIGWSPSDTSSLIAFSRDVPPGGGNWSLSVETVWGPRLRVQTTVYPTEGTHRYSLSTWAKTQGVAGTISIILNDAVRKYALVATTNWSFLTITDTISAVAGDSIMIELAGGFSQLLTGRTYYDLCTFQKSD